MNKKKIIIIISIIVGALVIVGLYGTFASNSTVSVGDNVYNIVLTGNSNEIVVPAGTSKTIIYQVTNTNKGKVNYGITFGGENIEVKVYEDSIDKASGLIDYGETKFVKLLITNTGTTDSTASVKVVLGYENDSNLNIPNLVPSGHSFVIESYTPPLTLINFIKKQYTSGNPELITHKDTDGNTIADYYYSYQDDTNTWGLMNDGLKIDTSLDPTTTGLATTVDSDAAENGTKGNIRYFGSSDKVNNYIYFNCSDYSNQTDSTCEKWRIIGIVDGKVKIIRNESIGYLAWDQDKNQNSSLITYNNNWTTSSLQEFLNGLYYNRGTIESHPYYSGEDGSTTTTLNLKTIGITEATRNNNLISESTWYLGGYKDSKLYPNQIYEYERTNKKGTTIYSTNDFTIQKNIGLMYPSDYGYGTDLTKCSQNLYNYSNGADTYACRANNWLFNSKTQWLIAPIASFSYGAWRVYSSGYVIYDGGVYNAYFGVRPVLYLDKNVIINGEGDGTSDNPYQIYSKSNTPNVPEEPNDTGNIIEHITNLYTSGSPTLITQLSRDDKYYYSYQDTDKTWGLMNDGFTIDTTQDATTTGLAKAVTDTTKLTSGTEGNIRYFGPSDSVNNYIYFNCNDYGNQGLTDTNGNKNCELWRIIGIVDGKVKIIRNESIGDLSWDYDYNDDQFSTSYTNNWSTSSLKNLLNGAYFNKADIIYYSYVEDSIPDSYEKNNESTVQFLPYVVNNSSAKSLGNIETELKFNSNKIGITEETRELISLSTWYLGGYDTSYIYPDDIYIYERTNKVGNSTDPYTINANIGLMYASDYGYGTNLTMCSQLLVNYHNSADSYACRTNNWLFNSASEWLITPSSNNALEVSSYGGVTYGFDTYYDWGVRPVLYLNSGLTIESEGDGSSTNPYRIKVS